VTETRSPSGHTGKKSRVPVPFKEETLALRSSTGSILLASFISGILLSAFFLLLVVFIFYGSGQRYYLLLLGSGAFGGLLTGILDREEKKLKKARDIALPLSYITILVLMFLLIMVTAFEPICRALQNSDKETFTREQNRYIIAFGLFIVTGLMIFPVFRIWKTLYFNLLDLVGGVDFALYYDLNLIETEFQHSLSEYTRYGHIFSLVLFDIVDHQILEKNYGKRVFQRIIGDLVLKINISVRATDRVGRAENGAFIALLTNTSADQALVASRRLAGELEKKTYKAGKQELKISITCGVSEVSAKKDTLEKLIREATGMLNYKSPDSIEEIEDFNSLK
jgi:diguanylate cyclase (GGDEF)-like protein